MKKIFVVFMSLIVLSTSITPVFADSINNEADSINNEYVGHQQALIDYEEALIGLENNDDIPEEFKASIREEFRKNYESIVNENGTTILNSRALPPFKKIAEYSKKVDTIRHEGNTFMAYGTILGLFSKIPLIGQGISATGGFFGASGALLYLSVGDLKGSSSIVGENWFRWKNQSKYEYQLYTKTYIRCKNKRISKIKQSPTQTNIMS